MKRLLLTCMLLFLIVSHAFGDPAVTTADILKDMPAPNVAHAYILASDEQVDDSRHLVLQSALVAIRFTTDHWQLLHIYRHPKEENRWQLSVVYDAPVTPSETYDKVPTRAEVEKFLQNSWWVWKVRDGFRRTHGEVNRAEWKSALNYEPAYRFK